jgi:N-methylhydantoinase B/oxoprolinase/acetone carboxylase alpha subunit
LFDLRSLYLPRWTVDIEKEFLRNWAKVVKKLIGDELESEIHGNIRFAKKPAQPFANGDLISVRTGGGGGWGDPHLRPPETVLKDVIDGYVSVASAKDVYHVVIDAATMAINRDSTVILRGK